jgi:membrane associated rhomboid family serine protease
VIPLRDENPVGRTPLVTYALIAANVFAFAWQLGLPGTLQAPGALEAMAQHLALSVQRGGLVPFELLTLTDVDYRDLVPPPFTLFTSMFLHAGPVHLGFNMLYLWIFGNNVEDALGRRRFLAFYLLAGVAAALVQVLASAVGGDVRTPMVGASGAISGALAAYLILFPRARVVTLLFVFVVRLPAVVFIGGWFLLQVTAVLSGGNTGVALFAHIGGFVAGLLLVKMMGRRRGWAMRPRPGW